jgi:hypothetical protein
MKNLLLFITLLLITNLSLSAQTSIFSAGGGGTLPTGWSATNNVTSDPIDKGTYYLLDDGSPGDIIETDVYDLSGYSIATFSLDVASFGSGTHNNVKIEISSDGGSSYTQIENSTTTTGSSYITGGTFTITTLSNQVKLKLTNNGTTGRSIRLRNLELEASGSGGPNVGFDNLSSSQTETDATFMVNIPVTFVDYTTDVDLSVSVTGGTAEVGDYTLNTSTLSFTGNGSQNISISINDDVDDEDETVEITIVETTMTGVFITKAIHTLTISDDDVIIPQILITEVADPSDNASKRMVEICNRGAVSVDITGWELDGDYNGNTNRDFTVNVSGTVTLAVGECYVFANNSFPSGDLSSCIGSTLSGSINSNGNESFWLTDGSNDIDFYDGQTLDFEDSRATRNAAITTPSASFTAGQWTVASAGEADITPCIEDVVLPVELTTFTATPNQKSIDLVWSTATEENNAYFDVQHSLDGRNFETIGQVEGSGTTYEVQEYTFIDENPTNGMNYYRLQQVDLNGQFENHKIVAVVLGGDAIDVLIVPTQVSNQFDIVLGEATNKMTQMDIFTIDGKLVRSEFVNAHSKRQTVDVTNFQSGLYIIRMNVNNMIITKRFVKL